MDHLNAPTEPQRGPGDKVAGRYVLKRKLGEGAAGVVWVARSTALDVDVALKMLRAELAGTQAVERMEREARTAAQLGHPALVRVLDFGISELSEPFLALELLEGEELHARLEREQRVPAKEAVALLLPIIDGLGTAHNKGIIHRDVKPENIFIASDSRGRVQPKMLDFGIAKLHASPSTKLTQAGAVVGSPYYLSPEQARGLDDIDLQTDIWSIGVVLYELVTGAPPFLGNNYNQLINSILTDAPKPFVGQGDADAGLWTIVEVCLRKERKQRWASMWELGEALALWAFERGVRTDASARSLRHGWLSGTITGVEILLPSNAPELVSIPPRSVALARRAAPKESSTMPAPAAAEPAPQSVPEPPRSRRGLLGGLTLLGAVAAVAGWWLLSGQASSTPKAAAPPVSGAALPVPPPVPAPASAVPAIPSVEPAPSVTVSAAASASAAPARTKATHPSSPRAPVRRPKSGHEFGF